MQVFKDKVNFASSVQNIKFPCFVVDNQIFVLFYFSLVFVGLGLSLQVDMDTCIDTVTELTQEEWDSIQSVLFEPNKSPLIQQAVADPSIYANISVSNTDCEPIMLTSELVSAVTSQTDNQALAMGGCKQPIQTVRTISFEKKGTNIVGTNHQVGSTSVGNVLNTKIRIQPKPLATAHVKGLQTSFYLCSQGYVSNLSIFSTNTGC